MDTSISSDDAQLQPTYTSDQTKILRKGITQVMPSPFEFNLGGEMVRVDFTKHPEQEAF